LRDFKRLLEKAADGTLRQRAADMRARDSGAGGCAAMDDKTDANRASPDLPPREEMPARATPAREQQEQQQQ
jgi:hypothetical protein